jgi:hypothetical protein
MVGHQPRAKKSSDPRLYLGLERRRPVRMRSPMKRNARLWRIMASAAPVALDLPELRRQRKC